MDRERPRRIAPRLYGDNGLLSTKDSGFLFERYWLSAFQQEIVGARPNRGRRLAPSSRFGFLQREVYAASAKLPR